MLRIMIGVVYGLMTFFLAFFPAIAVLLDIIWYKILIVEACALLGFFFTAAVDRINEDEKS